MKRRQISISLQAHILDLTKIFDEYLHNPLSDFDDLKQKKEFLCKKLSEDLDVLGSDFCIDQGVIVLKLWREYEKATGRHIVG